MSQIKSICVYCGSGDGLDSVHKDQAQKFGEILGQNGIRLVFGGGQYGLMGTIARAVMKAHGETCGIIPDFLLKREGEYRDLSELIVTKSMHERKQYMFEKSDAFVALPGGIGTLEEIVEMMTWAQLGRHNKPIILVNTEGFWDPLHALLDHMHEQEFIRIKLDGIYQMVDDVENVLPALE